MSFVLHANNICFTPSAIKNPQATTNKNPDTLKPARLALALRLAPSAAHAPQTAGVATKISNGKSDELITYIISTQNKASISDVAVGAIVSAVGVGGVGSYVAPKLDTQDNAIPGDFFEDLSSVIDAVSIDSTTVSNFLDSASIMKDGLFGLINVYSSYNSFQGWLSGSQPPIGSALTTVAHGLNAMALFDKVGGTVVGLGSYTGLAGSFANIANVVSGFQQSNMSQVTFSGAKLCATVALAGNPVATIAISSAEMLYKRYAG